jgi:hypothetical protein
VVLPLEASTSLYNFSADGLQHHFTCVSMERTTKEKVGVVIKTYMSPCRKLMCACVSA